MLKIDQIQDPEKLRRVAVLLDRTVDQLQERVKEQAFEIARLRGETMSQADFSFPLAALQRALSDPAEKPEKKKKEQPKFGLEPYTREVLGIAGDLVRDAKK